MSRELVSYRSGAIARTHDRTLDRIDRQTDVSLAVIQQEVETQAAKIEGALRITGRAAQGVAVLSQVEQQLSQTIPGSTTRVAYVVDRAVLEIGDMVSDGYHALRRIR